jgi:hypothetical protein
MYLYFKGAKQETKNGTAFFRIENMGILSLK